ncbi:MAG: pyridoxamine 5'-phosphate oxidase family protein [Acidimicrobiales bacterium]|nr:pyridoxamine 5'-phosphate oxidase family protein [Acidimicrobiales bacterium]
MLGKSDGFDWLDSGECLSLLDTQAGGIGRLAVVHGGHPVIFPVNYVLDQGQVVFRTSAGSKFDAAWRNAPVAFEIDALGPEGREGWSVLVQGRAEIIESADRIAQVESLGLSPWADGDRPVFVAIRQSIVTGRRIRHVRPVG